MSPKSNSRNVALCYVRLSTTQTPDDDNSPERQRANCQAYCDFRGWTAEFYEDTDGHKSGRKEESRPEWMALKNRIADPDVVALVANELSRFHRKGFRMGHLLELCKEHELELVKAGEKKSLDINDVTVSMWIMMEALFNEYYAEDIARRQRESARYRKAKGIVVGGIPFGTVRPRKDGKSGFLERSPYGVWLLPEGTFTEGHQDDTVPDGAVWRSYADAAERVLRLYGQNLYGRRKIAQMLNREGYRFRDATGQPAFFKAENIRGIVANWVEYGGAVVGSRAKNRRAKNVTPETVALNPERAIFDVDLCYQVGRVRMIRSRDVKHAPDFAVHADSAIYPLSKVVFCAHCERLAVEQENPALKSYLTGLHASRNNPRYRHKETHHSCGAMNKSVLAETLENDFARLVSHLAVKPETLPVMAKWFAEVNQENQTPDQRAEILAEVAEWKQRMKNADTLFRRARLSESEWEQDVLECERQIALLEARLSEQTEIRMMLEITANRIADMQKNWYEATPADKQAFVHSLFSEIIYDLDTRRIVGFKMKPWAESFLQLRVGLEEFYQQQMGENAAEPLYTAVLPEGLEPPTPGSEDLRSIP